MEDFQVLITQPPTKGPGPWIHCLIIPGFTINLTCVYRVRTMDSLSYHTWINHKLDMCVQG